MASEESKVSSDGTMRAVVPAEGVATFVTRPIPQPSATQVLIKVHYSGINRLDLLQTGGKYKAPAGCTDILGVEISGEVVSSGSACTRGLAAGTHVAALVIGGGYAEYCLAEEGQVLVLPEGLDVKTAAAIPEAWGTAYQILNFVGGLTSGDTVLIHAAGSGVGTSATQLAVDAKAKVIATAGQPEKLATAKRLGASAGFNRKDGSWAEGVMAATEGKGVNLILDCVGGSYYNDNSAVIALEGRWVLYGLLGGASIGDGPVLGPLMRKRVRLEATTLRTRSDEYKARLMSELQERVLPKFVDGTFSAIIDSVHPIDDVVAAQAHVKSNASAGKVLLSWV